MSQHSLTVFLIEGLQPNWLMTGKQLWGYVLSSRLIYGIVVGLGFVFYNLLEWKLISKYNMDSTNAAILIIPLINGLIVCLILGLVVAFFSIANKRECKKSDIREVNYLAWSWLAYLSCFIWGIIYGLSLNLIYEDITFRIEHIPLIVIVGVIFMLTGRKESITSDIQPVEGLGWSWGSSLKGSILQLILLLPLIREGISWSGLLLILSILVVAVIFGGLKRRVIEKTFPNQGIWLSIRNAAIGGLIVGMLVALEVFGIYI